MQLWTYGDAKDKVESELDIQGENFIDVDEMMALFNSAIDECESIIHQLHEDYFLTSDYVALVSGTADYAMPENIFANKIRICYYKSTAEAYEVTRIRLSAIPVVDTLDPYKYNIENNTGAAGTKFVVYPTPDETDSTVMRRWYIRNATAVTDDDSVIDIPEFIDFIFRHVKVAVASKMGHPRLVFFKGELDEKRDLMRDTLKTMIVDGNTDIECDMSFYEDSEA
jgi:hypothetical protein